MKQYKYKALNLQQEKFSGVFIAEDPTDLAVQLQKQGLFLLSCKEYNRNVKKSFFSLSVGGSVKQEEINHFSRQLAIMMNSGISLLDSLCILRNQKFSDMFLDLLTVIIEDVRSGMMFSDALEKHKKIFPSFFRSMIVIGEKSGNMGQILTSLADYYEHDAATKKKLVGALAYPGFLFALTIAITVVMMVWIIPTFKESMSSLEVQVTGITKVVYDLSDFMRENGLYVLYGVLGFAGLMFLFSRTKAGKIAADKFKLHGPIIGKITMAMTTSRFCRSFSLLLNSGMDIVEALESCLIIFNSMELDKKFKASIIDVKKGVPISKSFMEQRLFPPILIQMISVGEKTNTLSQVLVKSTKFFDEVADNTITSATSKIQPILLCILGGVIGVIFMAIYGPMLDMMTQI